MAKRGRKLAGLAHSLGLSVGQTKAAVRELAKAGLVELSRVTVTGNFEQERERERSPHTPLKRERKKNILYTGTRPRIRVRARTREERQHAADQLDLVTYLADQPARPAAHAPTSFELWWTEYPRKVRKAQAQRAYLRVCQSHSHEVIYTGLQRWKRWWADHRTEPQFIPHPATWLNSESWADQLDTTPPRPRLSLVPSSPAPTAQYADPVALREEARRRVTAEGLELDTMDGQQRYRELVAELAGVSG